MKKLLILFCFLSPVLLCNAQTTETKSLLIKKTTSFYKWYKSSQNKMNKFDLYKGKDKENNPPYHINWNVVEKYFAYIRTSVPSLGEAFITWHRADFKKLDTWFKENPEEEIPAGFDYERIVGGQVGIDEALEYAFPKKGKWQVSIKGNTATVAWVFMALNYDSEEMEENKSITEFKKEKGVWKISKTIGMTEIEAFDTEEKQETQTTI